MSKWKLYNNGSITKRFYPNDTISGYLPQVRKQGEEKRELTNIKRCEVPWACICLKARNYSNSSGPNREFAELLSSYNIQFEKEFVLGNYSYDFKIGNTLVEIDSTATHNILWHPFNKNEGIGRYYHRQKSSYALKNDYHCIHIFDWDNKEKIVERISRNHNVKDRYVDIHFVSYDIAEHLFNKYAIGKTNLFQYNLAVSYKNKPISIISYDEADSNKVMLSIISSQSIKPEIYKRALNLIREMTNPSEILVSIDSSKFTGSTLEEVGFRIKDIVEPRCLNLVKSNRLSPVYDCGQVVYSIN